MSIESPKPESFNFEQFVQLEISDKEEPPVTNSKNQVNFFPHELFTDSNILNSKVSVQSNQQNKKQNKKQNISNISSLSNVKNKRNARMMMKFT